MKASLGASSIQDFIGANTDYIIFYINKFLKKSYTYEDGLGLLQIILEYSSEDSRNSFYLETILAGLLQNSTKAKNPDIQKTHFKIYHLFLLKILSWRSGVDQGAKDETEEKILQKWLKILHHKDEMEIEEIHVEEQEMLNSEKLEEQKGDDLTSDQLPTEAEVGAEAEAEIETAAEQENLPNYVKLTDEIVRLVSKYISSKDQTLCLLSLELLTSGITILTPYEDKLLPVVHLIWFPLAEKFKSQNPIILRQCFNLLCLLAQSSRDFIHKRTISDIIPTINKFLTEVAKKSHQNSQQGMYRFSQEFKLIHTILSQYGQLILDIQIDEKNLDKSINCALRFLEKNQPEELQKITLDFCRSLLTYDAPTI
uniref:TTI1 C-terminal TPR domain-containing protein n=1 Tax=Lutzomyia longipalpis TaxID=7200 RepID=A0A1B0CKZ0_LUTLO